MPESIPADQSPVPKSADWDSADSFAALKDGQLGCEVKPFKEWLRVSCRGANSSGGTPSAVEAHGCGNDVYAFANPRTKLASVVLRVVKGRTCRSVFSWTDNKKETFVVDWSASPRAQAKFE